MDKAKYIKIAQIIKDIAQGQDQKGEKIKELEDALKGLSPEEINDIPKISFEELQAQLKGFSEKELLNIARQKITLQELVIDNYTNILSQRGTAADLLKALNILFQHKANPKVTDDAGHTLLHQLAAQPLSDIKGLNWTTERDSLLNGIRLLFENNVDFNARDNAGNTVFHTVIQANNLYAPIIRTLHELGAGLNVYNKESKTPLDVLNKKLESVKSDKMLDLRDVIVDLGGVGWKESEGGLVSSGRAGGRLEETKVSGTGAGKVLLQALASNPIADNFTAVHDAASRIDFTQTLDGNKTIVDIAREKSLLGDLFLSHPVRATIQSQFALNKELHDQVMVIAHEVDTIRQKNLEEQKQREKHERDQEAAEDKRAAEAAKLARARESVLASPIDNLKKICKMGFTRDTDFKEFSRNLQELIKDKPEDKDVNDFFKEVKESVNKSIGVPDKKKNFDKYFERFKAEDLPKLKLGKQ